MYNYDPEIQAALAGRGSLVLKGAQRFGEMYANSGKSKAYHFKNRSFKANFRSNNKKKYARYNKK